MAITSDLPENIVNTVSDYENVSPQELTPLEENIPSE